MHRHPQWEARLNALVARDMARPYAYGRHDCLLWAAAAAKAVTGEDYGRGHRGKYASAAGAARYLRRLGHETPESYLDSLFPEKLPGFAQRGDLVLAPDGIPALCMGDHALSVAEGNAGLARVPRGEWVKAWAVGEHHSGAAAAPRRRRAKR